MQNYGKVYNSFNEMAAGTGALAPNVLCQMSAFNGDTLRKFIGNTESQDKVIRELRDEVEFQPDGVIQKIEMYLQHFRGYLATPNNIPGGVDDMRKFITSLETMKQMAHDVKVGLYDKKQRKSIDLTDVQLRTGTPSIPKKLDDSDKTPYVTSRM